MTSKYSKYTKNPKNEKGLMKNTLLQSKVVIEEKELRMNQIEALYMSSQDQKDDEVIKK
jgi:hypothetical protein